MPRRHWAHPIRHFCTYHIICWDETSTAIALNTFTEGQGPQNARNGPSNKTADPPRACKKMSGQERTRKCTHGTVTGPQSRKQSHIGPAGSQWPRKHAMLEAILQLRACHARVRYARNHLALQPHMLQATLRLKRRSRRTHAVPLIVSRAGYDQNVASPVRC